MKNRKRVAALLSTFMMLATAVNPSDLLNACTINVAAISGPEIYVVPNTVEVEQTDTSFITEYGTDKTLRFSAARNERESGQIIIHSDKSIDEITVDTAALSNGDSVIPKENIEVFFEQYVTISQSKDHFYWLYNMNGSHADALLPQDMAVDLALNKLTKPDTANGSNQGIWFTVKVPDNAQAGTYRGEFKVHLSGEDTPRTVPVEFTVYDFDLPEKTNNTTFFNDFQASDASVYMDFSGYEKDWKTCEPYADDLGAFMDERRLSTGWPGIANEVMFSAETKESFEAMKEKYAQSILDHVNNSESPYYDIESSVEWEDNLSTKLFNEFDYSLPTVEKMKAPYDAYQKELQKFKDDFKKENDRDPNTSELQAFENNNKPKIPLTETEQKAILSEIDAVCERAVAVFQNLKKEEAAKADASLTQEQINAIELSPAEISAIEFSVKTYMYYDYRYYTGSLGDDSKYITDNTSANENYNRDKYDRIMTTFQDGIVDDIYALYASAYTSPTSISSWNRRLYYGILAYTNELDTGDVISKDVCDILKLIRLLPSGSQQRYCQYDYESNGKRWFGLQTMLEALIDKSLSEDLDLLQYAYLYSPKMDEEQRLDFWSCYEALTASKALNDSLIAAKAYLNSLSYDDTKYQSSEQFEAMKKQLADSLDHIYYIITNCPENIKTFTYRNGLFQKEGRNYIAILNNGLEYFGSEFQNAFAKDPHIFTAFLTDEMETTDYSVTICEKDKNGNLINYSLNSFCPVFSDLNETTYPKCARESSPKDYLATMEKLSDPDMHYWWYNWIPHGNPGLAGFILNGNQGSYFYPKDEKQEANIIGNSLAITRANKWLQFKMGIEGELFWAVDEYYDNKEIWTSASSDCNNGMLVYPVYSLLMYTLKWNDAEKAKAFIADHDNQHFASSIRLENMAESGDDYDYLCIADELIAQYDQKLQEIRATATADLPSTIEFENTYADRLQQIIAMLADDPNYDDGKANTANIIAAREELVSLIIELQNLLNGSFDAESYYTLEKYNMTVKKIKELQLTGDQIVSASKIQKYVAEIQRIHDVFFDENGLLNPDKIASVSNDINALLRGLNKDTQEKYDTGVDYHTFSHALTIQLQTQHAEAADLMLNVINGDGTQTECYMDAPIHLNFNYGISSCGELYPVDEENGIWELLVSLDDLPISSDIMENDGSWMLSANLSNVSSLTLTDAAAVTADASSVQAPVFVRYIDSQYSNWRFTDIKLPHQEDWQNSDDVVAFDVKTLTPDDECGNSSVKATAQLYFIDTTSKWKRTTDRFNIDPLNGTIETGMITPMDNGWYHVEIPLKELTTETNDGGIFIDIMEFTWVNQSFVIRNVDVCPSAVLSGAAQTFADIYSRMLQMQMSGQHPIDYVKRYHELREAAIDENGKLDPEKYGAIQNDAEALLKELDELTSEQVYTFEIDLKNERAGFYFAEDFEDGITHPLTDFIEINGQTKTASPGRLIKESSGYQYMIPMNEIPVKVEPTLSIPVYPFKPTLILYKDQYDALPDGSIEKTRSGDPIHNEDIIPKNVCDQVFRVNNLLKGAVLCGDSKDADIESFKSIFDGIFHGSFYLFSKNGKTPDAVQDLQKLEDKVYNRVGRKAVVTEILTSQFKPEMQFTFCDSSEKQLLSEPITLNRNSRTSSVGSLTYNPQKNNFELMVAVEDIPFSDDLIFMEKPESIELKDITEGINPDCKTSIDCTILPIVRKPIDKYFEYSQFNIEPQADWENSPKTLAFDFKAITPAIERENPSDTALAQFSFADTSTTDEWIRNTTNNSLDPISGTSEHGIVTPLENGWYHVVIPFIDLEKDIDSNGPDDYKPFIDLLSFRWVNQSFVIRNLDVCASAAANSAAQKFADIYRRILQMQISGQHDEAKGYIERYNELREASIDANGMLNLKEYGTIQQDAAALLTELDDVTAQQVYTFEMNVDDNCSGIRFFTRDAYYEQPYLPDYTGFEKHFLTDNIYFYPETATASNGTLLLTFPTDFFQYMIPVSELPVTIEPSIFIPECKDYSIINTQIYRRMSDGTLAETYSFYEIPNQDLIPKDVCDQVFRVNTLLKGSVLCGDSKDAEINSFDNIFYDGIFDGHFYESSKKGETPQAVQDLQKLEDTVYNRVGRKAVTAEITPAQSTSEMQFTFCGSNADQPISQPITLNFDEITSSVGSLTANDDNSSFEFLAAIEDIPFTDDLIFTVDADTILLVGTDNASADYEILPVARKGIDDKFRFTDIYFDTQVNWENSDKVFSVLLKSLPIASEQADDDTATHAYFNFKQKDPWCCTTRTDYTVDILNEKADIGTLKSIGQGWYQWEIPLKDLEEYPEESRGSVLDLLEFDWVHHAFVYCDPFISNSVDINRPVGPRQTTAAETTTSQDTTTTTTTEATTSTTTATTSTTKQTTTTTTTTELTTSTTTATTSTAKQTTTTTTTELTTSTTTATTSTAKQTTTTTTTELTTSTTTTSTTKQTTTTTTTELTTSTTTATTSTAKQTTTTTTTTELTTSTTTATTSTAKQTTTTTTTELTTSTTTATTSTTKRTTTTTTTELTTSTTTATTSTTKRTTTTTTTELTTSTTTATTSTTKQTTTTTTTAVTSTIAETVITTSDQVTTTSTATTSTTEEATDTTAETSTTTITTASTESTTEGTTTVSETTVEETTATSTESTTSAMETTTTTTMTVSTDDTTTTTTTSTTIVTEESTTTTTTVSTDDTTTTTTTTSTTIVTEESTTTTTTVSTDDTTTTTTTTSTTIVTEESTTTTTTVSTADTTTSTTTTSTTIVTEESTTTTTTVSTDDTTTTTTSTTIATEESTTTTTTVSSDDTTTTTTSTTIVTEESTTTTTTVSTDDTTTTTTTSTTIVTKESTTTTTTVSTDDTTTTTTTSTTIVTEESTTTTTTVSTDDTTTTTTTSTTIVTEESTTTTTTVSTDDTTTTTTTSTTIVTEESTTTTTTVSTGDTTTTTTTSTTIVTEESTTTTTTVSTDDTTTTTTSTTIVTEESTTTTTTVSTDDTTTTTTTTFTTIATEESTTTTTTVSTDDTTTTVSSTTEQSTTSATTTSTSTTGTTSTTSSTTSATTTNTTTSTTTTMSTVTTTTTTASESSTSATESTTTSTTTDTTTKPIEQTETTTVKGDITGDGEIGIEDAQLTLNAYVAIMAELESGLTDEQAKTADVNGDNIVSVEDAQFILIYYVQNTVADMPTAWEEILN